MMGTELPSYRGEEASLRTQNATTVQFSGAEDARDVPRADRERAQKKPALADFGRTNSAP